MMPMGVGFLCMLRAESLTKSYLSGGRELTVLHGITFDLEPGGFLAIVGPSGSGKSTLLALLAGLDQPTSGRVVLDGTDLGPLSEDERARLRRERVGFVFQASSFGRPRSKPGEQRERRGITGIALERGLRPGFGARQRIGLDLQLGEPIRPIGIAGERDSLARLAAGVPAFLPLR